MKTTTLLILLFLLFHIGDSYLLKDLIDKLNGYEKSWISGINKRFEILTLEDTMKMMGN
jgi:hypothetical protein